MDAGRAFAAAMAQPRARAEVVFIGVCCWGCCFFFCRCWEEVFESESRTFQMVRLGG